MREFNGNGSSSAPLVKAPALPEQTQDQKQQEAIAETQRYLKFAGHQLESVQRTQDLRIWRANHAELLEAIATSTEALEKAKQLQADADTLTALQTRITTLGHAAAGAKPPRRAELARESEIYAALTAKPQGSAEAGHQRKEATIDVLFRELDVADTRALLGRIKQCLPEDKLVAAFHELEPSRQAKLLKTLEDAGRREAVAAEPARRAALETGRESARGGVLHAGPAFVGSAPAPARGLPVTAKAPTAATSEVETLDTKLRRILEAGEPDEELEAQLEVLFGELDDATRRALAQRFERYRQGNGDDIAARFYRLDPPVHRHLLGALTAPARRVDHAGRVRVRRRREGGARFLEKLEARLTEPAPFLRKVDTLLAVRNIAADDLAAVLSSILDASIGDPVVVLDDIEWISTRPLSAQARSTLIRRAAKGKVDLDWVKRTRLIDRELEIMGQDNYTDWAAFEKRPTFHRVVSLDVSSIVRHPKTVRARTPRSVVSQVSLPRKK